MENFQPIINDVFRTSCKKLGIKSDTINYGLFFVSSTDIKKLNKQFRGVDKATDVLSFPFIDLTPIYPLMQQLRKFKTDINPETGKLELGDIVICTSVARAQAKKLEHSPEREVAFLFLHGFLHLLGYNHITKEDEETMTTLQREIIFNVEIQHTL